MKTFAVFIIIVAVIGLLTAALNDPELARQWNLENLFHSMGINKGDSKKDDFNQKVRRQQEEFAQKTQESRDQQKAQQERSRDQLQDQQQRQEEAEQRMKDQQQMMKDRMDAMKYR